MKLKWFRDCEQMVELNIHLRHCQPFPARAFRWWKINKLDVKWCELLGFEGRNGNYGFFFHSLIRFEIYGFCLWCLIILGLIWSHLNFIRLRFDRRIILNKICVKFFSLFLDGRIFSWRNKFKGHRMFHSVVLMKGCFWFASMIFLSGVYHS